MRAAVFKQLGEMPELDDLLEPIAEAGDVIIDVVVAPVLAYHDEVFAGKRPMLFELPFVPGTGAIGRVAALGAGATELAVGTWVYCDPTLRGRDGQDLPAISLQGLTANGPAALPILRQFPNGSWADKLRLPMENVFPLGDISAQTAPQWLMLGTMLVPYGGLTAVDLRAGETVLVNGATGSFGSAAVAVALGMGAARVIATGRNRDALAALSQRYGSRVRPVEASGGQEVVTAAIAASAGAPIDVVLDILPPAATPDQVLSAMLAVRPGGRIVLMGGVGMAGGGPLNLPYPWLMRNNITLRGQWMYPRDAVPRLIEMARSSLVDLSQFEVIEFPLNAVREAICHAGAAANPFIKTVLRP